MDFRRAFDPARSLSNAWKLIQRAPAPLLLGGILLTVLGTRGGGIFRTDHRGHGFEHLWPFLLVAGGFACVLGIGMFLLSSWIQVGWLRSIEQAARTGRTDFGTVFGGGDRWLAMVLVRFLQGLIQLGAMLPLAAIAGIAVLLHEGLRLPEGLAVAFGVIGGLLYLPVVVYVALGLALAPLALALEGLEPGAALRRSWSLVSGNRLWLLLYSLLSALVVLAGFLACCIGVLFTATWVGIAWTEAYLALIRPEEHGGWWIQTGSPPPDEPRAWGSTPPPPPTSTAGSAPSTAADAPPPSFATPPPPTTATTTATSSREPLPSEGRVEPPPPSAPDDAPA